MHRREIFVKMRNHAYMTPKQYWNCVNIRTQLYTHILKNFYNIDSWLLSCMHFSDPSQREEHLKDVLVRARFSKPSQVLRPRSICTLMVSIGATFACLCWALTPFETLTVGIYFTSIIWSIATQLGSFTFWHAKSAIRFMYRWQYRWQFTNPDRSTLYIFFNSLSWLSTTLHWRNI